MMRLLPAVIDGNVVFTRWALITLFVVWMLMLLAAVWREWRR